MYIKSPITNHQSPITNHQSPITNEFVGRLAGWKEGRHFIGTLGTFGTFSII
jgi:hypothetical protein